MSFWSTFYEIEVRDEIAREFTDAAGHVDDMMAGLHEIRARMAEQDTLEEKKPAKSVKRKLVTQRSSKRQKKQPAHRVPVA